MLYCNDVISIIKCDGEAYTVSTLSGVSWYDRTQVKTENAGLVYANSVKVRIPTAAIPADMPLPEVGDHIVHGALPDGVTIARPADLAALHPRKVMAVADNRRGGIPHVAVIGQ